MSRKLQTLKGFRDLLPGETEHWQRFEAAVRSIFRCYGFREIRTPSLEPTELFVRSVGEETDIVGKEMFTFERKSGKKTESMTLRPEITAAVCRAYVAAGLDRKGQNRLLYIGPCFRAENPQRGRLRQFHQVGAEIFTEKSPASDVELIALAVDTVRAAGVSEFELVLNSIGDESCRPAYRRQLIDYLESVADQLTPAARERIQSNPMRVLDSKDENDQRLFKGAPSIVDALSDECREHFDVVKEGLASLGIPFTLEPRLVRGLDYYVNTTFEIRATSGGLGAQNTILGGGRYDGLVKQLGGGDVPGLGWAAGIERLLLAAGLDEVEAEPELDAYFVTLGEAARASALPTVQALRSAGLAVGWDPAGHGLGGQMKRAGRSGARFAILVGDDELASGRWTAKDLKSGTQEEAPGKIDELVAWVRDRLAEEENHGE